MTGTGRQVITIYGRQPVMEALDAPDVDVEQVLIATGLRGGPIDEILDRAERAGAPVKRVAASKVTRISGNGRHDQGVVADVVAPGLGELDEWLAGPACAAAATLVLLDGVTNPGNVGMIIRTVTAAGLDGVVLPRLGAPDVGPLVVKASAGVAFRATILQTPTASAGAAALVDAGFELIALEGAGPQTIYDVEPSVRSVLVLGNETEGVSAGVAALAARRVAIPLANGVESLNVASAAAVACFELARRRRA